MTATGPFGPPPRRSSSAVNDRPSIGGTPQRIEVLAARVDAVDEIGLPTLREVEASRPPRERERRPGTDRHGDRGSAPTQDSTTGNSGSPTGSTGAARAGRARSTGRARSSRLLTIENMAVLAPMPSASDRMTTSVTTGVARIVRMAIRRSFTAFSQPAIS